MADVSEDVLNGETLHVIIEEHVSKSPEVTGNIIKEVDVLKDVTESLVVEEDVLKDVTDALHSLQEEYTILQDHLADIELKYQSALSKASSGESEQFRTKLQTVVADLFDNELYSDIEILLDDGKKLHGHKLILSARCESWAGKDLHITDQIDLRAMDCDVAVAAIRWVYTDNIDLNVDEDFLIKLLKAAAKMKLIVLFNKCEKALISGIKTDNVHELHRLSLDLKACMLKAYCLEYMYKNQEKIMKKENEDDDDDDFDDDDYDDFYIVEEGEPSNPPRKKKQLKCDFCSKKFKSEKNKKSHMEKHALENVYKCHICEQAFKFRTTLRKHIRVHSKESCFKCEMCSKMFDCRKDLANHKKNHEGAKPYQCDQCECSYFNMSDLQRHVDVHLGVPKLCTICGREFKSNSNLQKHLKLHSGIKPHKCTVCEKSFLRKSHLQLHEATHTGVKNHTCDQCGKKFLDWSNFQRHYRIHTGEKPHQCHLCEKAFIQSTELKRHLETHISNAIRKNQVDKDGNIIKLEGMECNICCHGFNTEEDLQKHKLQHEPKYFSTRHGCNVCGVMFSNSEELSHHILMAHVVNEEKSENVVFLVEKRPGDVTNEPMTQFIKIENLVHNVDHTY